MDAERWRAAQRSLREAVRSQRRSSDAPGPVASSPAALPLASVIVVCWNSADVLGRCLEQLQAQDYANYEIVVVDDGSQDDTLQVAERAATHGELTIVRSPRNQGCPHARNLGLAHARGEIVAFIDADGFAAPSWLRHLVAAFAADETIGGVASTVFFAANPLVINGAGGIVNRQGWAADLSMNESYERAELASEALYPMGCGMAVRRSAVERVGPFDDRMLNYYDDVDYGMRLWRAGYRVVVAAGRLDRSRLRRIAAARLDAQAAALRASSHAGGAQACILCASLGRWALHEARTIRRAAMSRRYLKLRAMAWNARHLPSVLSSRRRLRASSSSPGSADRSFLGRRLPGWRAAALHAASGEAPATASTWQIRDSEDQLLYGWFTAGAHRRAQLPLGRRPGRGTDTAAGARQEARSALCPRAS